MKNSCYYANNDIYNRIAINLVIFVLFFNPILHCIKLLRFGNTIGAAFFYVTFPLIASFFVLSLFFGRNYKTGRPDIIEIIILTMLLWGSIVTIIHSGSIVDILANALRMVFALACYHTTRVYAKNFTEQNIDLRMAKYGFLGTFIAVIILYSLGVYGPFPVYLGLGTSSIFVALAYVLVKKNQYKKWIYACFVFMIIVLGGKRGHMLSAFVIIFVNFFLSKKNFIPFVVFLSAFVFGFFIVISTDIQKTIELLPKPIAARVIPFIVFQNEEALTNRSAYDAITSGRMNEVVAVLDLWKKEPFAKYTGKGLGATFINQAGDPDSTVHISPIALSFIFGVPLTVVLISAITLLVIKNLLTYKKITNDRKIWVLAAVGYLMSTLSLFTIFQDPLIWISLGMISNKDI